MNLAQLLKKLVSFKTTSDNQREIKDCFKYISLLFSSALFQSKIFEKNKKYSLLVSFKKTNFLRPKILLLTHIDVVPAKKEDFQMKIKGNIAYGRGVGDMKGMIAVAISLLNKLAKENIFSDVGLLITGDEEVGGEDGAGYLVKEIGLSPKFVLGLDERGEFFKIVIRQKGGVWLELKAVGRSAHSARLWEGENALEKIIKAIEKIKKFIGPIKPEAWKSTCNLSSIETPNKTPNKVPDFACAVLDIRFTEKLGKSPQEVFKKIKKLVPEVEVSILKEVYPFWGDFHHPFFKKLKNITKKITGKFPLVTFSHGASDLRHFGEVGIKGFGFGPKAGNIHGENEWVDLESLEQSRKILIEFLKDS